jgi:hypothetical protein
MITAWRGLFGKDAEPGYTQLAEAGAALAVPRGCRSWLGNHGWVALLQARDCESISLDKLFRDAHEKLPASAAGGRNSELMIGNPRTVFASGPRCRTCRGIPRQDT